MNITCNEEKNLFRNIDNELTPDMQKAMEVHISEYNSCRKEVLESEKLSCLFKNNDIEEEVSPVLVTSTWKVIESDHNNRTIFDFLFNQKSKRRN